MPRQLARELRRLRRAARICAVFGAIAAAVAAVGVCQGNAWVAICAMLGVLSGAGGYITATRNIDIYQRRMR